MIKGRVEVGGLRELNAAIRRAEDTGLPRRMGEANRSIGRLVISKLEPRPDPAAVGKGSGATVRPSATKSQVVLRVGGSHRHRKAQQWGRQPVKSKNPPKRPHIIGTVEKNRQEIEREYLKAVTEAMSPAFWRVDVD